MVYSVLKARIRRTSDLSAAVAAAGYGTKDFKTGRGLPNLKPQVTTKKKICASSIFC